MARFFDGERAIAHDVVPLVLGDVIAIQAKQDGSILARWPLQQIVAPGGAAHEHQIVLAFPKNSARLIIDDAATIAALARSGVQLRPVSGWTWPRWTMVIGLLLVVLLIAILFLGSGPRWAA